MKSIQAFIERTFVPFSNKLGQNKVLQSISAGMIMTLPVTIGASIFSILANFPVKSVNAYFEQVGLTAPMTAIVNGSTSILGVFIAFSIAYAYAQRSEANGTVAGLFSLASYLMLAPQTVGTGKQAVAAFPLSAIGSEGIIVAMILAILVSILYVKLSRVKRLVIKLPESVPSMVSDSLAPLIIGIIIFALVFLLRWGFSVTEYETLFAFANKMIAAPLMNIGGSAPAIMLVFILSNLLFLFGIHPAAIQATIMPVVISMMVSSAPAYQSGQTIPYLENLVVFSFVNNDAAGATLSLLVVGLLVGRSQRYRQFFKISIIPNIFNINEPVIYGMPVVLNVILFVPFLLASFVSGGIGWLAVKVGFITSYNPILGLGMPWTLPKPFADFLTMGWQGVAVFAINFVLMMLIYLPFFKILDRQALAAEQQGDNESED